MTEIVNLRRRRKALERAARETVAEQNRVLFGETRSEKNRRKAERIKAERTHDGHKREPGGSDDPLP